MKLPPKKVRKQGRLDKLPKAVRDEILERSVRGESWASIRAWLRSAHRCRINHDTVCSQWYARQYAAQQVQTALELQTAQVEGMMESLRRELPEIPQEKLDRFGQYAFSALALSSGDPKTMASLFRLQLAARKVAVEEQKVELLKRAAEQAERARGVVESALSPEQKQTALREIFGLPT